MSGNKRRTSGINLVLHLDFARNPSAPAVVESQVAHHRQRDGGQMSFLFAIQFASVFPLRATSLQDGLQPLSDEALAHPHRLLGSGNHREI